LRYAIAALALPNVTVEKTPLEQAPPGRFDLVTLRALFPLSPAAVKSLFRLLKPALPGAEAGCAAAYKGHHDTAEKELAALDCRSELIPLSVPCLDEERHLALLYPVS
jgi:16S rRNA G527 N7-methylase RsmG